MSGYSKAPVDVAVTLEHETPMAYLVNEGHKSVWIPKSQTVLHYNGKGVVDMVTVPEWLAYDKGLI